MIKMQSYTLCNQFFFQKCVSRNKEINEYYANAEFTICRVYQVPSLPGAEFTGCRVHYSRCRVHQVPGLLGAGFTSIRLDPHTNNLKVNQRRILHVLIFIYWTPPFHIAWSASVDLLLCWSKSKQTGSIWWL